MMSESIPRFRDLIISAVTKKLLLFDPNVKKMTDRNNYVDIFEATGLTATSCCKYVVLVK